MNSADIEISQVTCGKQCLYYFYIILCNKLSPFLAGTVTYNKDEETVSLEFPSEVTSSSGPIHIEYTGTLNDQMKGFYRSKYTHPDTPNVEKYGAVTQFEVTMY